MSYYCPRISDGWFHSAMTETQFWKVETTLSILIHSDAKQTISSKAFTSNPTKFINKIGLDSTRIFLMLVSNFLEPHIKNRITL